MTKYALDTDTLSYYLKGNQSIIDMISNEVDNGNFIIIPPAVFFEIKRWLLAVKATKIADDFRGYVFAVWHWVH